MTNPGRASQHIWLDCWFHGRCIGLRVDEVQIEGASPPLAAQKLCFSLFGLRFWFPLVLFSFCSSSLILTRTEASEVPKLASTGPRHRMHSTSLSVVHFGHVHTW